MLLKSSLLQKYGKPPSFLLVTAAVAGAAAFNVFLHRGNIAWLGLPLFLDMIGTLFITVFFGLLPGIITGILTHIGVTSYTFTHVSICSALLLWFLIRKRQFTTLIHAVLATIYITFLNAIFGALTAAIIYKGFTYHPIDNLVTSFLSIGQSMVSSAFWARIPINLIDKGIAVFISFGAMRMYIHKHQKSTAGPQFPPGGQRMQ